MKRIATIVCSLCLSTAVSVQDVRSTSPLPTTTTGSGSVVLSTSPTLVTPALGTPASGVATNLTGTASGLTAGSVTTNANLTGPITSSGNATSVAAQTGTGSTFVMQATPTLTTPVIGAATGTSLALTGQISANTGLGVSSDHATFTPSGLNAIPNYGVGYITSTSYTTLEGFGGVDVYTNNAQAVHIAGSGGVAIGSNTDAGAGSFLVNTKITSPAYIGNGSVPTPTGTCAVNTQLGGNTIGSFKANGTCTAGTVILTFATTATNGWGCEASDLTTRADAVQQTAYTTTTATFTGTMVSADLVTFHCMAF